MAMTEEDVRRRAKATGGTVGWSSTQGFYLIPSGQVPAERGIPSTRTPITTRPMPERAPAQTPTRTGDKRPSPTFTPTQYKPQVPVTNWMDSATDFAGGLIGGQPAQAAGQYQPSRIEMPGQTPPPQQPYPAEPMGGGLRFPWQTPPDVGFIAPWTEQARYIDPSTGQPQYIQTEGAPEQVAAGAQYGQLPATGGVQGTRGPWMSPQDIPPELLEQYDWEWFTYEDPTLGNMEMVQLVPKAGMTPFQEWQTQQVGQEQVLPGTGVPIPGGAQEGQIIERADGSTFMWMRGQQGYPMPREISPPTQKGMDISATDQAALDLKREQMLAEEAWRQQQLEAEQEKWQSQLSWQQQQFQQQQQWAQQQWQQQLGFEEQARVSALAGQPQSWLQYHALEGTQPQVQPWMMPLMSQQYPELQAGANLPGWQGETGVGQPMTTLPELLRPSAQYQARMGPQSWAQYLGYQQARTGALPEQANWTQQQYAPGGWGGGLQYTR